MPRFRVYLILCMLYGFMGGGKAHGQCVVANPSFEIAGSGGIVFGGWNQFGSVGKTTSNVPHGHVAARASGPNTGNWDVSGFWQTLDSAPGERWSASVCAWHSASNPLSGSARAILNVEWRDGGGNLISYESHTVADASTPAEELVFFSVESGPAPPGTASTHLLLGALQGPADPSPTVFFDQVTFLSLSSPTQDEIQWLDFPGGRTFAFSGRSWRVKGPGFYGPGPNYFCSDETCVWVDELDRLHMTIQKKGASWFSTEVTLEEALGYGDYVFTVDGPLDQWHPNVVLGLFLWEYAACFDWANGWWNPYNEIDVEISRWGDPGNDEAQFVAQPYDWPGNILRFDATAGNPQVTSHAFRWLPDRVEFRSWRGGPEDEAPANLIRAWTYTGPHIPRPEQPRIHINFWQFFAPPDVDQEAVLEAFTFTPACFGPHCITDVAGVPARERVPALAAARPNPIRDRTTIAYAVPKDSHTEIMVYDVGGRFTRKLVAGFLPAGNHEVVWDARDDSGRRVPAGIYWVRIRMGDFVAAGRMVVLE